jgi:glutamate synthase domain-containing protein 3
LSTELRARQLGYRKLNDIVRAQDGHIVIRDCFGERFIGSGASDKTITIYGTPGNALGAYLDGAAIEVFGNAQDAVGDTMNSGEIIVHGHAGDALGYAMRGGIIYVQGDSGYRTGIHMKQYQDTCPVIVVGGTTGSFLGEYLAGGLLIVLGLGGGGEPPVNRFTGTAMHGGLIYLRCDEAPDDLPDQVAARVATDEDMRRIVPYLQGFAAHFGVDLTALTQCRYHVLSPKASPKQLYTIN